MNTLTRLFQAQARPGHQVTSALATCFHCVRSLFLWTKLSQCDHQAETLPPYYLSSQGVSRVLTLDSYSNTTSRPVLFPYFAKKNLTVLQSQSNTYFSHNKNFKMLFWHFMVSLDSINYKGRGYNSMKISHASLSGIQEHRPNPFN